MQYDFNISNPVNHLLLYFIVHSPGQNYVILSPLKTKQMKPITRLYLKVFLLTGVPYGLLMTLWDVMEGKEFQLWKFLFLTFFFGITMSWLLVSQMRSRLNKIGIREIADQHLQVHQTRAIRSRWGIDQLAEKIKGDPKLGRMKTTRVNDGIMMISPISWKSWGERIRIILNTSSGDEFEYQVSSQPRLGTTIIDFGKSLENVDRIEHLIGDV